MNQSITSNKKIYIVIPAFNEGKVIGDVIDSIKSEGFTNIIVVDDGSFDSTSKIAKEKNCITLKHLINRGKGAATQTGIDAAKILNADIIVTIDGDGQHYPEDIKNLIDPIINGKCEVALGSRLLEKNNKMPFSRKIMNDIANSITFFFYGIYVSDSQSGFRAYGKSSFKYLKTQMDRYEFESEIIHIIKLSHLKFNEIPIRVNYSEYSKTKYNGLGVDKQGVTSGIKMLFKMIIRSIMT